MSEYLVEQWEIGSHDLSQEMTALLNLGWSIRDTQHFDKWLVVIFMREKQPDNAENLTKVSERDK